MEKIKKIRNLFLKYKLDGYLIPKNDRFFGEFVPEYSDNLKFISDFSGSFGFAIILRKKIIYLLMADIRRRLKCNQAKDSKL